MEAETGASQVEHWRKLRQEKHVKLRALINYLSASSIEYLMQYDIVCRCEGSGAAKCQFSSKSVLLAIAVRGLLV